MTLSGAQFQRMSHIFRSISLSFQPNPCNKMGEWVAHNIICSKTLPLLSFYYTEFLPCRPVQLMHQDKIAVFFFLSYTHIFHIFKFGSVIDKKPHRTSGNLPITLRANHSSLSNCVCVCGKRLLKRLMSPSPKSQVMFASALS